MSDRGVVYVPPSPEVLEHFVRAFYREYSDERPSREDVLEFTGFLKAISSAVASDLTRKANGAFDTRVE